MKKFNVMLVGLPNNGKTSIFNRMTKVKRQEQSIVFDTEGVTRNTRKSDVWIKDDLSYSLSDTAGMLIQSKKDPFLNAIQKHNLDLLKKADLILFVVNVLSINKKDFLLLEKIRKLAKPIILLFNKCDTNDLEEKAVSFEKDFQIHTSLKISAKNGRNFHQLDEAIYLYIKNHAPEEFKQEADKKTKKVIKIAIIGKPNVGKSSLLNTILKENQSLVSEIPGTTTDPVEAKKTSQGFLLSFIDTAGLRKKTKIDDQVEKLSSQKSIRSLEKADIIFFLIDLRFSFSTQEKKILKLIKEEKKKLILTFTKIDEWAYSSFKKAKKEFILDYPYLKELINVETSAKKNKGIQKLIDSAIHLFKDQVKISNQDLFNAIKKFHQDFFFQKKEYLKISFIKIRNFSPLETDVFVKSKKKIESNYTQYLKKQIKAFLNIKNQDIFLNFKKLPFK